MRAWRGRRAAEETDADGQSDGMRGRREEGRDKNPRGAREGLFLIANFFPGKRSVAPSAQNPKFEFLDGEMKLQLFGTCNAVLNCWGMIGWWTTSIIPKKFKTAPKLQGQIWSFGH